MHGVSFGFEHPKRARTWKFRFFIALANLTGMVFLFKYDGCAWGARASDWHPNDGDVRIEKGSVLVTNRKETL